MKKYLLQCTYSNYNADDDDLVTNTFQIGNFDTLDECFKAVADELLGQAEENAEDMFDEDEEDELNEYVSEYCRNISKTKNLLDIDFARPLADRIIANHWYDDGNYKITNIFIVTKIGG